MGGNLFCDSLARGCRIFPNAPSTPSLAVCLVFQFTVGLMSKPTRAPLAVGNVYQFLGYPTRIKIVAMSLPGHRSDDGGLPGVAVEWLDRRGPFNHGWYVFQSEDEFWSDLYFRNVFDPQDASIALTPA